MRVARWSEPNCVSPSRAHHRSEALQTYETSFTCYCAANACLCRPGGGQRATSPWRGISARERPASRAEHPDTRPGTTSGHNHPGRPLSGTPDSCSDGNFKGHGSCPCSTRKHAFIRTRKECIESKLQWLFRSLRWTCMVSFARARECGARGPRFLGNANVKAMPTAVSQPDNTNSMVQVCRIRWRTCDCASEPAHPNNFNVYPCKQL